MMAVLFLLFAIALFLIARAKKQAAFWVILVNLVLMLFMFIHHVTIHLDIRL